MDELCNMHERELNVKTLVLSDIGVCEQIDTLTIYLAALLLQPRLADAESLLKRIELMLDC